MKKTFLHSYVFFLGFIVLCCLNACVTSKDLAYFNNIQRDSVSNIQFQQLETIISKNDVLQINISTLDETITRMLNSVNNTSSGGGYLVDETGIVKLPFIGALKAAGLTKHQLADLITVKLLDQKIAKDPIVSVRIINYKITVLGEVGRPGVISVPSERITFPEALASAGDLTVYGKRYNVLLIRENGDKRIYKRFSLNNDRLFDRDIYNLQNQDIIYVEPNNAKAATSDRTFQLIPLGLSVISLLLIIYTQFIKK